jgi:hypothetical protein
MTFEDKLESWRGWTATKGIIASTIFWMPLSAVSPLNSIRTPLPHRSACFHNKACIIAASRSRPSITLKNKLCYWGGWTMATATKASPIPKLILKSYTRSRPRCSDDTGLVVKTSGAKGKGCTNRIKRWCWSQDQEKKNQRVSRGPCEWECWL